MTHHHHHHDHDKPHSHDHEHTASSPLSFEDKMARLLTHWIQHNNEHAENYRSWARQAADSHLDAVAEKLDAAARLTDQITSTFTDAETLLSKKTG